MALTFLNRLACVAFFGCFLACVGSLNVIAQEKAEQTFEEQQAEIDAQVAELIVKLGADEFATREKAHKELERLGLLAFDALFAAQTHKDVEVAFRARHLVRSIRVNWSRDDDPADVKRILHAYGAQNSEERRSRMQRLAAMEEGRGLVALARLARFEVDDALSKQAALMAMNITQPEDPKLKEERALAIKWTIGSSPRDASQWLKAYSVTLVDPEGSLAQWSKLTRRESQLIVEAPQRTDGVTVRDLLRWHAELLLSLDRKDQAYTVMREMLPLINDAQENNYPQLLEATDWFMKHKAWSVVEEVAARFETQFSRSRYCSTGWPKHKFRWAKKRKPKQRPTRHSPPPPTKATGT